MHSSQYDEIYSQIVERTKELRLGSALSQPNDGFIPTVDVGAMANPARFADLERVVEQAAAHGATVDVGGTRWRHPYLENGAYFVPTVVGNVDPLSELAQRESTSHYLVHGKFSFLTLSVRRTVFAPIATIISYDTLDQAVEIANGTRYGLGASVFGPDQEHCVKVAKRLQCGMVSINDFAVFYVRPSLLHYKHMELELIRSSQLKYVCLNSPSQRKGPV